MGLCISTYKTPEIKEEKVEQTIKPITRTNTKLEGTRNTVKGGTKKIDLGTRNAKFRLSNAVKISPEKNKITNTNNLNTFGFEDSSAIEEIEGDEEKIEMESALLKSTVKRTANAKPTSENKFIEIPKINKPDLNTHEDQVQNSIRKAESILDSLEDESVVHLNDKLNPIFSLPEENKLNNLLQYKDNAALSMENDFNYLKEYSIKKIIKETDEKILLEGIEISTYSPVRIIQINKKINSDQRTYLIPEISNCFAIEQNIKIFDSDSKLTIIQPLRKLTSLVDISGYVITEKQLLYIIFQIIYAVSHLHKQGIYLNNLTVDSFSIISNFKNEFFNICLNDYSFFKEKNSQAKSDIHEISIIFYYLCVKRMPYENLEEIKARMEPILSKYALSLIAKLNSANFDFELKKMMDHRSFNVYDINLSTVGVLNDFEFIKEVLDKLRKSQSSNEQMQNLSVIRKNSKQHDASINFIVNHIMIGKSSISLNDSKLNFGENELALEEIVDRFKTNLEGLLELVNSNKLSLFEYDCSEVGSYYLNKDKFKGYEDIKNSITFSIANGM